MSNLTAFENWVGNGTEFNNTAADVHGLGGMAGTPVIMGVIALAVVAFIIIKQKPTFDLSMLMIITMLEIVAAAYAGDFEWLRWSFILVGGGFLGFGLIKMKKGG